MTLFKITKEFFVDQLKILLVFGILLFYSCGAHYKLMPKYDTYKDQIQTIAIYPLYYTDNGKEPYLFGAVFSDMFDGSIKSIQMNRPIEFTYADETISFFAQKGVNIIKNTKVINIDDEQREIILCRRLNSKDAKLISDKADGIIFCDLLYYNEVSVGGEIGQKLATGLATGCLTGGMATTTVSEQNELRMEFSFLETRSGETLWEYTPHFVKSYMDEPRMQFTLRIIDEFQKYFPFSEDFEGGQ